MSRKRIASVLSILLVLGLLAWSQWRSSRLDARAPKIQLAMSEAEVDLWLGPEAVPGRMIGTTEITDGHAAGVETAAYTKSWIDPLQCYLSALTRTAKSADSGMCKR